ncbi:MAG: bifunctional folylpolyglutamate synthase/dihydrofolate synthase [Rickettsiales bacterium]|nr:bifunctional folylpolyglutamate synthase/dihydrofolate synthase [Rickettsiales bacterium]
MKFPFWPDQKGYRDIDLGLSRVYQLLERLDNPHLKLPPTIHLAGTNGKGSTLSFLRSIFAESGLSVHTYTSPHLVNFNERITLAGAEISDDFLNKVLRDCKNAAEISPKIEVTYFEGITVAAFLAFSQVKADVLLLEVGMGGRLDATNVLPKVLCSIITPIAFDHTDFLGNTLAKIAFEKGGIIKKNCPTLIGKQKASALKTLENQACTVNSAFKVFDRDWKIKKEKNGFLFEGFGKKMSLPLPSLLGDHQLENASLAIAAALLQKQFLISENQIKSALQKTFWAARLQKIESGKFAKMLPKSCKLYLDGSHNLQGAATILRFLKIEKSRKKEILKQVQDDDSLNRHPELVSGSFVKPKNKKIFVIFSMLEDKDCGGFLKKIAAEVDHLFALAIPNETKSRKALDIKQIAEKNGLKTTAVENFDEAFAKILSLRKADEEALILVCGSLYLAGSFLAENATI